MAKRSEAWIDAHEAAEILTKNSGHKVSHDYVRLLANNGKVRARAKDGRTKEYHRGDIEAYKVRGKKKTSPNSDIAA